MQRKKNFTCEIVEHIVVLGTRGTASVELNRVSYDGREPKFDLRPWYRKPGAPPKPLKGLQLNDEEIAILKNALNQRQDIPTHDA